MLQYQRSLLERELRPISSKLTASPVSSNQVRRFGINISYFETLIGVLAEDKIDIYPFAKSSFEQRDLLPKVDVDVAGVDACDLQEVVRSCIRMFRTSLFYMSWISMFLRTPFEYHSAFLAKILSASFKGQHLFFRVTGQSVLCPGHQASRPFSSPCATSLTHVYRCQLGFCPGDS